MTNQEDKKEKKEAIEEKLERITEAKVAEEVATRYDEQTILINEEKYHIVENYNEAFDIEKFNERFSDILEKYDYIVGDMSYDMLRLRGFYEDSVRKAPIDMRISSLEDYLVEYCSFGCGYYVLKRESARKQQPKESANHKEPAHKKEPMQKKEATHKRESTPHKRGARSSRNTTQQTVKKETLDTKVNKETNSTNKKSRTRKEFTKKDISKEPERPIPAPKAEKVKTVKDKQGKKKFEIRRKNTEGKD
ncbi:YutD family protein [Lacticigenium naphthae]|uniref:YutD family protein n=1 Tax=Lacticigenium naphthae TaxID=515351 RepID=UPI0003F81EC6|nr:YutD family protein [Lacticigenium naphthae]